MRESEHVPSIIMVDDEKNNLLSMERVFRSQGYHVEACFSATEALAAAGKNSFDVALLDINMPGMSGLDLVEPMRKLRPDMDVLFVTGDQDPSYARKAADQRVAGYVVKPVDMQKMLDRVEALVREQQHAREVKRLHKEVEAANARLTKLNSELDQKVKERTADLVEKNRELGREVTQRKRAEEKLRTSEALLRSMVDNAPDAVVTFDTKGKIHWYNRTAERLFLYSRSEAETRTLLELIPGTGEGGNSISSILSGDIASSLSERWAGETKGMRKNGQAFDLSYSVSRVTVAHGKILFIGVMQDITDRVVKQRLLEETLEKTQNLNDDKVKMVGSIAHEVLNPVNTLMNLGKLSEYSIEKEDMARLRRYLNGIVQCGKRIDDFMRELVTYSKLQVGDETYDFKPGELVGAIHSVIDLFFGFEKELTGKSVRFIERVKKAVVSFDHQYIAHVLRNLIVNALKFSQEGDEVVIEVAPAEYEQKNRSRAGVKVSVVDRGKGVPDDQKQLIFNRYYRGEASAPRKKAGTGIGLSVARDVIVAHGGKIWCEDNPRGRGAVFIFILPLSEEE